MKIAEFTSLIISRFGYKPTADQEKALLTFGRFLADRSAGSVMIMRGSAGTGKTSLASAMVRTFHSLGQKLMLLAPTGRAAKVFARNSGMQAYTIHRKIYREKAYTGTTGEYRLNDNLHHSTLFFVDEASMCSSELLRDLVSYVYQGDNCRLMLIGDSAQLPPVGEEESPALQDNILQMLGLRVYSCNLNEVLRQTQDSGILWNATMIRQMITHDELTELPKVRFEGFADIINLPGNEVVEAIADSYSSAGEDETIVITRSNKSANIYNQGIRTTVLDREDRLCGGDRIMIVKNKYGIEGAPRQLTFIANGDSAVVRRVHNIRELYGFNFADVTMEFPDYDDAELDTTVILDTLISESPALTSEESERLYNNVMEDYADLPLKHDRLQKLKQDSYFNALQIKFAYAVTCHKAQGGQWKHVYIDQGYMTDDMLTPDYLHWLYTAFTRATSRLYLVNWKQ